MTTSPRTDIQSRRFAIWLSALLSVLGAFEVLMAAGAASVATVVVGVVGGAALFASPWVRSLRLRWVLLLIGALPFAILTWWTVAGPLVAVAALAIGLPTLRHGLAGARRPAPAGRTAVGAR